MLRTAYFYVRSLAFAIIAATLVAVVSEGVTNKIMSGSYKRQPK